MPSTALREFDRQFRDVVVTQLATYGFALGKERVLRRIVEHENTRSTQIIEFQIGKKGSLIGHFTVNLAIFNRDHLPPVWTITDGEPYPGNCLSELTQRLGFFRVPQRGLIDRIIGRQRGPRDHWWCQSSILEVMRVEFEEVMNILLSGGFRWLNTRTSIMSFRWALRQLELRKEWKASLGAPNATRLFTPEPFPTSE